MRSRSSRDDLGQVATVDQPHGEVRHSALGAIGENRDDVGVLKHGGGLGLDFEPPQLPGVEQRRRRQHLDRHAAAQRDLPGLVDHSDPAPADLAPEPEIPQDVRRSRERTADWSSVASSSASSDKKPDRGQRAAAALLPRRDRALRAARGQGLLPARSVRPGRRPGRQAVHSPLPMSVGESFVILEIGHARRFLLRRGFWVDGVVA